VIGRRHVATARADNGKTKAAAGDCDEAETDAVDEDDLVQSVIWQ